MAEFGTMSESAAKSPPALRQYALQNLAVLVTVIPFTIACLRLLAISSGNSATLSTLISTLDLQGLLISTFVTYIPQLLLLGSVAWMFWWWRFASAETRSSPAWQVASLAAGFVLISSLLTVYWLYLLVLLVTVAIELIFAFRKRRREGRLSRGALRADPVMLVFVLVITPLMSAVFSGTTFWLPSESLSISGAHPVKAYVLQDQDGQVTVLMDKRHSVLRVPSGDVKRMGICGYSGFFGASLFTLITSSASAEPKCPN